MKAEHRKQLQTNALADRVGKFVQTLKTKPQKRTFFYVILAVAVVLAVVLYLRYRSKQSTEKSMLWVEFENGHRLYINKLAGVSTVQRNKKSYVQAPSEWDYGKVNVGKAARFQYAFQAVWESGVKALAARPPFNPENPGALGDVQFAKTIYKGLHKECEEDPVWGAEALYNLAVVEETLAVQDGGDTGKAGHLTQARKLYQQVVKDYPKSVQAKHAEKKAAQLKEDSDSLKEVSGFYQKLAQDLKQ